MRRKITILVPVDLLGQLDVVAKRNLGVGRTSFFCLAAVLLLAQLGQSLPAKKRLSLLSELQLLWDRAMTEARKMA